jgi:hypothetical protein
MQPLRTQGGKMSLTESLHRILPKPCYDRPFVCDGRPDSCDVIVIGENPVTKIDTDWWSFWDDDNGFNPGKFEEAYEKARSAVDKRPISNTRLRLKRLRRKGLRCLETNVFRNEQPDGHGGGVAGDDLLRVFFEYLPHLKSVITHGEIAQRYLNKLTLPVGVTSHCMRHFRSESYENIDNVTRQILSRC